MRKGNEKNEKREKKMEIRKNEKRVYYHFRFVEKIILKGDWKRNQK